MINDNRGSDIVKRRSRRHTLLCYSTLCLFSFLTFLLLSIHTFHNHSINFQNKSISLNVINFRSSLIQCGQSIVRRQYLYQRVQQFIALVKANPDTLINDQLSQSLSKEDLILWLEYILKECYQARQFLIYEQGNPMLIRRIISKIRKEVLYIAAFFLNDV